MSASNKHASTETEEQPVPFSFSKRQSLVASFAQAFWGGQISIVFPTAAEAKEQRDVLAALAQMSKEEVQEADPVMLEAGYKRIFRENAMIVLGVVESDEKQQQAAVNFLIETVWRLRMAAGKRIQGDFLAIPNIESTIKKLEEEVRKHSNALDELRILLRLIQDSGSGQTP